MAAPRAELIGGVLGIDPGLSATGWGVLNIGQDGAARLVWGVVRPPAAASAALPERLHALFQRIGGVIRRYEPAEIAIERPFLRSNFKSAMSLGHAQAAVCIAAAEAGLPVSEYAPREVKEAVAGIGSAGKEEVALALARRLRIERLDASADASDALAVAYCHLLASETAGWLARAGAAR